MICSDKGVMYVFAGVSNSAKFFGTKHRLQFYTNSTITRCLESQISATYY